MLVRNTNPNMTGLFDFLRIVHQRDRFYVVLNSLQIVLLVIYYVCRNIQYSSDFIQDDIGWRAFPSTTFFCYIFHNSITSIMIERLRYIFVSITF